MVSFHAWLIHCRQFPPRTDIMDMLATRRFRRSAVKKGVSPRWMDNTIWWLYRFTLVEWYKQLVLPIDHLSLGSKEPTNKLETTHIEVWKITEACHPKTFLKICEGISCSSSYVKGLDAIVHKNNFPCITILNLVILYPTSLANLVVEVGTRHSHRILFQVPCWWASSVG